MHSFPSACALALCVLAAAPPAAALSVTTFAEDGRDPLDLYPNGGQAQWTEPVEAPDFGTYGAGQALRALGAVAEGSDGFSFTLTGADPFQVVLEDLAVTPGLDPAETRFRLLEETGGVFSPLATVFLTPPAAGAAVLFGGLSFGPGRYGLQISVEDKTGETGSNYTLLVREAAVPAPPALVLTLGGLVLLAGLARRRARPT